MSLRRLTDAFAAITATLLLTLSATAGAGQQDGFKVAAPHFGEVLFNFYQQKYFTALTDMAVSEDFGRLSSHAAEAELLRGGMLLSWGQHRQAGEIFEQLLATSGDPALLDRSRFYLGKVRLQRGYLDEAASEFEAISGTLPDELEAERINLQAQVYMGLGRNAAAVELLTDWTGTATWTVYARYNLGVALLGSDDLDGGTKLLEQVGLMNADAEELLALRDRANLALGFAFLQAGLEGDAKRALQRIRLNGPSSNKALLGAGWASASNAKYRKALAPWMELSERNLLDSAVQESLLAVPYAFTQLDAVPQAAEYYVRALDVYNAEITRLDGAISDMDSGQFVDALLVEEMAPGGGWHWQLEKLPDDAQARYLYFAIADHSFHEGLKSYRAVRLLSEHFADWQVRLDTYRELVAAQQEAIATRLSELEGRNVRTDIVQLWAQHQELQDRLSLEGRNVQADIDQLLAQRQGLPGRLSLAGQQQQLKELDTGIMRIAIKFEAMKIRTTNRAEAMQDFDRRMTELAPKLTAVQQELQLSLQDHQVYLNAMLRSEMQQQRQRLISYRAQARFGLASVYDRLSAGNR
jgi:hypothetical protein